VALEADERGVRKSGVMSVKKCPFVIDDIVVYRPSQAGHGQIVMTDFARLIPGRKYRIVRIEKDNYIVPEGFENTSAGGLFWTEFSAQ
jgi:hypothetical protein